MKKQAKKLFLFMAVVITAIVCMAFSASALTYGDFEYETYNSNSVTITYYFGKATKVTIPSKIDGKPVTEIAGSAFKDCTAISSISIPDSVESIGSNAFYNTAYYNKEANWKDGVLYIGKHLIKANSNVLPSTYSIKSGTLTIAANAFQWCNNLEKITIPSGLKGIGSYAFWDCSSLKSVTIPAGVKTIGSDTFRGCSSLESIAIPDGITYIAGWAFVGCSSLKSVVIPASVKTIGYYAFEECKALTDVYYTGTKQQWSEIEISTPNRGVTYADIHYNYSPKVSAPGKTSKITATSTPDTITLKWNAVKNATGYRIYKYNESTKKYESYKDVTSTSLKIKKLSPGTSYSFKVRAYIKSVNTVWGSYSDAFTTTTTLAKVTGVSATQTASSVTLKWSKVTGATSYRIYQYNSSSKKYEKLADVKGATTYTVSKLKSGTKYLFKIRAYAKDGVAIWGAYSDILEVVTKPATPSLKVTSTMKETATLTWTNVKGESGYEILYSTKKDSGFKNYATLKENVSKIILADFTSGKTYYFRVRAFVKTDSGTVYSGYKTVSVKVK